MRNFALTMIEKKNLDFEKAVLIGIITRTQNEDQSKEYLDELEFLTYTAGGQVVKRFVQKMDIKFLKVRKNL